jgi:hypothetical protein
MQIETIDLSGFYGTENYYTHPFTRSVYTDGVKYFAEKAGAYWFLDIVFSEYDKLVNSEGYLSVTLKVSRNSAIIDVSDGNGSYTKPRHIDFTDCPDGEYKFYFIAGEPSVLMLAAEY